MHPHVTVYIAEKMHRQGRPFIVRLEYQGFCGKNKSQKSSKFWQILSPGLGPCIVSWGRLGSKGRSQRKQWEGLILNAENKLNSGYYYCQSSTNSIPDPSRPTLPGSARVQLAEPYADIGYMREEAWNQFRCFDHQGGDFLMEVTRSGAGVIKSSNDAVFVDFL